METKTRIGSNRTGVQMSPLDAAAMARGEDEFNLMPDVMRLDMQLREDYAGEADALGSVPLPGSARGLVDSALDLLAGHRAQVLIDKLGERLAFERGGVRLYEALLVKCRVAEDSLVPDEVDMLQRFRDQEAEHMDIVASALRDIGADPTAQTPCADLVGIESLGLVQAMNDPRTTLLQSLHVMLDAELLDNAGWDLLIDLARAGGHDAMAQAFQTPSMQEAQHLRELRLLVSRLTLKDATLGSAVGTDQGGTDDAADGARLPA